MLTSTSLPAKTLNSKVLKSIDGNVTLQLKTNSQKRVTVEPVTFKDTNPTQHESKPLFTVALSTALYAPQSLAVTLLSPTPVYERPVIATPVAKTLYAKPMDASILSNPFFVEQLRKNSKSFITCAESKSAQIGRIVNTTSSNTEVLKSCLPFVSRTINVHESVLKSTANDLTQVTAIKKHILATETTTSILPAKNSISNYEKTFFGLLKKNLHKVRTI